MNEKKLIPPFYNKTLDDFFGYKCELQDKAIFMQNWLLDNYPDLKCGMMYRVPMFKISNKNVCYLQYKKILNSIELQICFGKGNLIEDKFKLFKPEPKIYRAIIIDEIDESFLNKLKSYINQAINLIFVK